MIPTTRAVLETILATLISLFIAIKYETLLHIAVGSCLAPFLLLRSDKSIAHGRNWFLKVLRKNSEFGGAPTTFLNVHITFWALIIRLISTIRYPIDGLKSIPNNWYQIVFCIDTKAPAYILPSTMTVKDVFNQISGDPKEYDFTLVGTFILSLISAGLIYYCIDNLGDNVALNFVLFMLLILLIMMFLSFSSVLLCFIGSYAYRLSLKSTALLWLPLLYVSHTTFDESLSLKAKIYEQKFSAKWKLIRFVSWMTLLALFLKICILPNYIVWWNSAEWTKILDIYVMPNKLHIWHIAGGLNAMIALVGYYIYFDQANLYIKENKWNKSSVLIRLKLFTFTRGIISIYTIVIGILLTITALKHTELPEWSWVWIPPEITFQFLP